MEIVINNEKIDYTLENETNLNEIIRGVECWLKGSHLIITSIMMEERELTDEPEESWINTPLSDVAKLTITAKLLKEIQLSSMETVIEFLGLFLKSLDSRDRAQLEEVLRGCPDMLQSLRTLFKPGPLLPVNPEITELGTLLAGSDAETVLSWPEGIREKALLLLQRLRASVQDLMEELSNPLGALQKAAVELKVTTSDIESVSVLLQTGQDKKAMDSIIRFADLSQKTIRALSNMEEASLIGLDKLRIDDKTAKDFFKDFNRVLQELVEAFDGNDIVLIGDILEYEISPRLAPYLRFIDEIQKGNTTDA